MLFPENHIYIWFLFPVKAKHLVLFIAVLQLLQGISGPTGIAYFAHLGGMAAGLFFFRRRCLTGVFSRGPDAPGGAIPATEYRGGGSERQKVDSILDTIANKRI